jgi:hypothetical protein
MPSILDSLTNFCTPEFAATHNVTSSNTLFKLISSSITNAPHEKISTLMRQTSTLDCLTEISISLAFDAPHQAPFPAIIQSIHNEIPPLIRSPQHPDLSTLAISSPSLSSAFFDSLKPLNNVINQITGPLVLHQYDTNLIVSWHSPLTPEIYQANLPLTSVILTSFIIHHHLGLTPTFNCTGILTKENICDLSYDILRILHLDPSVFTLLPHIHSSSGLIHSDAFTHIRSYVNSTNIIACTLKTIVSMCFPHWYLQQIPLCASRRINLTHHLEFQSSTIYDAPFMHINCFTLTMDITPFHAALQRISSRLVPESDTLPPKLRKTQLFLQQCPPHIYLTILQHTLAYSEIPCMPVYNRNFHPIPRWPIIYYHPRFGNFRNPDSSASLNINLIILHTDDEQTPSIVSPNQAIHSQHCDPRIVHAHHAARFFKACPKEKYSEIFNHFKTAFGPLYKHTFLPTHSNELTHLVNYGSITPPPSTVERP